LKSILYADHKFPYEFQEKGALIREHLSHHQFLVFDKILSACRLDQFRSPVKIYMLPVYLLLSRSLHAFANALALSILSSWLNALNSSKSLVNLLAIICYALDEYKNAVVNVHNILLYIMHYSPIICITKLLSLLLVSSSTRTICCQVPSVNCLFVNGTVNDGPTKEALTCECPLPSCHAFSCS